MKNYLYLFSILLSLSACEDVVKIDVKQKETKLVVDAFVNNLPDTQSIYLKFTANYFAPIGQQTPVTDASVFIIDTTAGNVKIFGFTHKGNGRYTFIPNATTGDTFTINHNYGLAIVRNGDTFISLSSLNPTASFNQIKRIEEPGGEGIVGGSYAEIDALDRPEIGNTYWIKTYRNDSFINGINDINIAYDQSFSPNDNNSGGSFIWPIRYGAINQGFTRPYKTGEKIRIEIQAINLETFYYLQIIQAENQNGGLFATPPSSIPSNIFRLNKQGSINATGWFNMAAVASKTLVF